MIFGEAISKQGDQLIVGFVPAEARFSLGERVRFSVPQFREIVFTLALVTNPVLNALVEQLRQRL